MKNVVKNNSIDEVIAFNELQGVDIEQIKKVILEMVDDELIDIAGGKSDEQIVHGRQSSGRIFSRVNRKTKINDRGKEAEQLVFDYLSRKRWNVELIGSDRKVNLHADIVGKHYKSKKEKLIEVKWTSEEWDDHRIQITKEYIYPKDYNEDFDKIYFLLVGRIDGSIDIWNVPNERIAKLVKNEVSPAKIELSQIEKLPKSMKVDDFDDPKFKPREKIENWFTFDKKNNFIQATNFDNIPKPSMSKKEWLSRKKIYNEYIKEGMIPLWAGGSNELVPLKTLKENKSNPKKIFDIIAEKPAFIGKKNPKHTTTKGNRTQTRARNFVFWGQFQQKTSKATIKNPIPLIFETDKIRVDNDTIGHYVAFVNNMYSLRKPYSKNMYLQKNGEWVKSKIEPVMVNQAIGKSIMDSIGFEQGKIIKDVLTEKLGNVMVYRGLDGESHDLSLSEQQMGICDQIIPDEAVIRANTPNGIIDFTFDIENIPNFDGGLIKFVSLKKDGEIANLTSDKLLISVVRRFQMEATTVQALVESLNRQGWITYPRVSEGKAINENEGIQLLKDIETFSGSQDERRILEIIKSFEDNSDFIKNGKYELHLGKTILESASVTFFADQDNEFTDEQFDLEVTKSGITRADLVEYLVKEKIGTTSNRTIYLEELVLAGIISLKIEGDQRVYSSDQRGYYLKSAFDYLKNKPEHSAIIIGNKISEAKTIKAILENLNLYEMINPREFIDRVNEKVAELLDAEKDIKEIEDL